MDFSLSEEQQLYTDSLRKLLEDHYDPARRLDLLNNEQRYDEGLWRRYAELGFLGLPFAEDLGGFGGTAIDLMLAGIEFGRALSLEPYLSSVVLGGSAIRLAGNSDQQRRLLGPLIAGELKLAVAFAEPQARYDLADVETCAENDGDGYLITGKKAVVIGGDCADHLILSARVVNDAGTETETYGEEGISLFIVAANTPGASIRDYRLTDGRGAAEISLDKVSVNREDVLGEINHAYPVIDRVIDLGTAILCAEALGAMEAANNLTLDYLKTREQFGRPIGKFQVLQHRMVDMMIELEQARSLTYLACMEVDNADSEARRRAVSAAKVQVGEGGRFIAQNAIQSHGGIGVTLEYALGHYVKRLSVIEALFGDVDHHLARFGNLLVTSQQSHQS